MNTNKKINNSLSKLPLQVEIMCFFTFKAKVMIIITQSVKKIIIITIIIMIVITHFLDDHREKDDCMNQT